ncbi:uncharacterized protein [Eurosta solidaginis]|uniref:uncharacterized protein n=1 Tax=Eurosta solidaginis TaxID=178769 RepID=UPI003530C325
MQKKRVLVNTVLDKLHRGAVYACMGVTLYGTFLLGLKVKHYFTESRPQIKAEKLKMIEEDVLDKSKIIKT